MRVRNARFCGNEIYIGRYEGRRRTPVININFIVYTDTILPAVVCTMRGSPSRTYVLIMYDFILFSIRRLYVFRRETQ